MTFPLTSPLVAFSGATANPVGDVFAVSTWTGTGASRSIANNINLASHGGMVWIKTRTNPAGTSDIAHRLQSEETTVSHSIAINTGSAQQEVDNGSNGVTSFNVDGFSLGGGTAFNGSPNTFVGWTFRKKERFFDVVTYTGNGSSQAVSHALGITPGLIIVKRRDAVSQWVVWHRSGNGGSGSSFTLLDNFVVSDETVSGVENIFGNNSAYTAPSVSTFTVGNDDRVNASAATYVAYVFAHDTLTDGIVQCGTFTTSGSGAATVTLGWSPQFLMLREIGSSEPRYWEFYDTTRGWTGGTANAILSQSTAEENVTSRAGTPTSTGFNFAGAVGANPFLYMAIRATS